VTKPNPENCKNCSSKCAYDCAQLQYAIQNRGSNSTNLTNGVRGYTAGASQASLADDML